MTAGTNRLPRWYFLFAHLCLGVAGLLLIVEPATYARFFYQPRTVALVHLMTLGWITSSIFGALYMIGPIALRIRVEEKRLDKLTFWVYCIGVSGMVSHFWLDSYSGMVWSASMAVVGPLVIGARFVPPLSRAPIALGARLHLLFAFVNLVLAGFLGLLVGLSKTAGWPSFTGLSGVYAHLHLAAIGWASMLVFGVAYRLVPMVLPAKAPTGLVPVASALVLELGVLALAWAFLFATHAVSIAAALAAVGCLLFGLELWWMLRNRRPRARHLPRFDVALVHLAAALVYLGATIVLGLALASGWLSEAEALQWALVYGVFGLVGFLAQMVVGMSARLWPLYAWFLAKDRHPEQVASLPGPSTLPSALSLGFIAALWLLLVPLLAFGLFREQPSTLRLAGCLLLLATAVSAWHQAGQLRRSHPAVPGESR